MPEIAAAAITAAGVLGGSAISASSANSGRDKQLAYLKQQDALAAARQKEIDLAEKKAVSDYNARMVPVDRRRAQLLGIPYVPRSQDSPIPTSTRNASSRTLGSVAGNPAYTALSAPPPPESQTLGSIGGGVPWGWGRGGIDPRSAGQARSLGSLAGRG